MCVNRYLEGDGASNKWQSCDYLNSSLSCNVRVTSDCVYIYNYIDKKLNLEKKIKNIKTD